MTQPLISQIGVQIGVRIDRPKPLRASGRPARLGVLSSCRVDGISPAFVPVGAVLPVLASCVVGRGKNGNRARSCCLHVLPLHRCHLVSFSERVLPLPRCLVCVSCPRKRDRISGEFSVLPLVHLFLSQTTLVPCPSLLVHS